MSCNQNFCGEPFNRKLNFSYTEEFVQNFPQIFYSQKLTRFLSPKFTRHKSYKSLDKICMFFKKYLITHVKYIRKDTVTFLLNLLQHHYLNELSQACHVKDINLNTTKKMSNSINMTFKWVDELQRPKKKPSELQRRKSMTLFLLLFNINRFF